MIILHAKEIRANRKLLVKDINKIQFNQKL